MRIDLSWNFPRVGIPRLCYKYFSHAIFQCKKVHCTSNSLAFYMFWKCFTIHFGVFLYTNRIRIDFWIKKLSVSRYKVLDQQKICTKPQFVEEEHF